MVKIPDIKKTHLGVAAGALAGLFVAGPIGAAVGAVGGWYLGKQPEVNIPPHLAEALEPPKRKK